MCIRDRPRIKRRNTGQNVSQSLIAPNLKSKKIDVEESGSMVKKEQNTSEKEKSALYDHLKSYIPPKKIKPTTFLPSTVDGLYDQLCLLLGELKAGNTAVKSEIITILKKLQEKGILNMRQCDKACAKIQDIDSENEETSSQESESGTDQSSDSDSDVDEEKSSSQESESGTGQSTDSNSEVEDEEFNQLIRKVADNLAQNERKNLLHAL